MRPRSVRPADRSPRPSSQSSPRRRLPLMFAPLSVKTLSFSTPRRRASRRGDSARRGSSGARRDAPGRGRQRSYFLFLRWMRVFFSSLRCFFLAIRLRRFLMTEPIRPPPFPAQRQTGTPSRSPAKGGSIPSGDQQNQYHEGRHTPEVGQAALSGQTARTPVTRAVP